MNKEQVKAMVESESLLKQETKYNANKKEANSTNQKYGEDVASRKEEAKEILKKENPNEELISDLYVEARFYTKRKRLEEPKGNTDGSFFSAKEKTSKYETIKTKTKANKTKYVNEKPKPKIKDEIKTKEDRKVVVKKQIKNSKYDSGKKQRFETGSDKTDKRFRVSEDELSDIIASKRKTNVKLTEKELRQKAYFVNKLENKSKNVSFKINSDDLIVSKTFKRNKKAKRYQKTSNAFSSVKYHVSTQVNKFDPYMDNNESIEEDSFNESISFSKYAVDTPIEGIKSVKVNAVKKIDERATNRKFNVRSNKVKNKTNKKLELILQDKKTSKRFILLKHKKEEQVFDSIKSIANKIVYKLKLIATRNKIGVIIAALTLVMFISAIGSIGVILQGISEATGTYLTGLSLSTDFDMTDAENYFTKMEADLQEVLDNIEEFYPGYDRYDIYFDDEIYHDPLKLMAYLSSVYEGYDLESVKEVLDKLFDDMYVIEIEELTEVEDDEEISIFSMTITKTKWDDLMSSRIDESKKDLYESYEENGGGHQSFHNPFEDNWSNRISSEFGWRIHPISGEEKFHKGVDIAMPYGTAVKSCSEGTVVKSYYSESAGNYVVVEDKAGYLCHYMHLAQRNVSVGESVGYDTLIGTVGSTGYSTGPHLHLQVTDTNGEYLNPKFMVQGGY